MQKYTVKYGNKIIEFELIRKNIKNINLNVKPNMSVIITANEMVPVDYILKFAKEKAPWIIKKLGHFKNVQPESTTIKNYVSGESFKYLGKQYRLKVNEVEKESVKYLQGYIELNVKDKSDYQHKENLVNKWFDEKALINFQESINRVFTQIEKYGVKKPCIMIRTMKARWGSCVKDKNTIILNRDLIKAPKFCIDYVVLHEIVHLLYRNHDSQFYNFMTSLMPDWRQRKEILDEEVIRGL